MKINLTKQKYLVKKWFDNVLEGIDNEEVLFLNSCNLDNNREDLKTLNSLRNKIQIINAETGIMQKNTRLENGNVLIYLPPESTINRVSYSKIFKRKILFVKKLNGKLEEYIKSRDDEIHDIKKEERHLYYMEKVKPIDILDREEIEIKSFLEYFIKNYIFLWKGGGKLDLLFNNTSYKLDADISNLDADIVILKNLGILTSRLAVIIYRVATLYLDASVTEAGRYFHKELGIKSKTYNYKSLTMGKENTPLHLDIGLMTKNFKAYDISKNELEFNIRKEIAKNLIGLRNNDLDIDVISKVTGLPRKETKSILRIYLKSHATMTTTKNLKRKS